MVLWFPAYGDLEGGYVVRADGGGIAAVRPPPPFCRPQRLLQGRPAASLAAAGLFGGKFWPLQGRCKAVTLAPLLMMLLLWNILSAIFKFNVVAAVKCSLCYLQVLLFSSNSLQVSVSSCVVSNKNKNNAEL